MEIKRTILLRGIDPMKMYEKYINGHTETLSFQNENKIVLLEGIELDYEIGNDTDKDIYEINDSYNNKKRIFTDNVNNFNDYIIVHKDNKNIIFNRNNKNETVECDYCKTELEKKKSLGIPLNIEIIEGDNKCIIFHVHGNYCCFEHMYVEVIKRSWIKYKYTSINESNIDHNTRVMFNVMYPGEKFTKNISNPIIKSSLNGPLKDKDYEKHTYVEMMGIITLPCKRKFMQIK